VGVCVMRGIVIASVFVGSFSSMSAIHLIFSAHTALLTSRCVSDYSD